MVKGEEEKRGTAVSQAAPSLPLSDLGCFSSAIHSESFRSTCWLNALTHYRAFEILWTSSFPVWRIFSPSLPSQCFSYCALSTIDWFNNLLFSLFVLDKTNSLPWYHNYSWGRKKSLDQWETADIQLTNYSFFFLFRNFSQAPHHWQVKMCFNVMIFRSLLPAAAAAEVNCCFGKHVYLLSSIKQYPQQPLKCGWEI